MAYTTSVAGTVITASWANANVRDQVITPFVDAAARTAAISSPVEGMVSYLTGVNRLDFYNGAGWQPVIGASAKVVRSGDMTILTNVATKVEWQVETYDDYGMWTGGAPTMLTAPWAGFYIATTTVQWASQNLGFIRRTSIKKNDVTQDRTVDQLANTAATDIHAQNVACGVKLAAGDDMEVEIIHDAGASRTIEATISNFTLTYLGSG